ncbi:pB475L [African swine fever virus]|uniref:BA71V-B475L n=1 Tax=African swine fever virus TaxID=10497 RepID=A0A0C5B2K8_ASF|nr:BA71V-B475L [African swine fever virus]AJL34256.1 BA71V-B475L [African swine fever virus]AXB49306.1 pB475L [African swine fever virus]AXB49480.1 pB475L [African swine fever virus]AXB49652.1 pB475L [African swine fever virus]AXB49823.1 pB475L [African swine fever virus]
MDQEESHVISIFETFGAYFINIFYNFLYKNALYKKHSIVMEYQYQVKGYILGVKQNKKLYEKMLDSFYKYFCNITQINSKTLSFSNFVSTIVDSFLPKEYSQSISLEKKDSILELLLCDYISNLGTFITTEKMLPFIVKNRKENYHRVTKEMQDYSLTFLLKKRMELYNKFLRKQAYVEPKTELEETYTRLSSYNRSLLYQIEELTSEKKSLLAELSTLRKKYEKRQSEYRRLVQLLYQQIQRSSSSKNSYPLTKFIETLPSEHFSNEDYQKEAPRDQKQVEIELLREQEELLASQELTSKSPNNYPVPQSRTIVSKPSDNYPVPQSRSTKKDFDNSLQNQELNVKNGFSEKTILEFNQDNPEIEEDSLEFNQDNPEIEEDILEFNQDNPEIEEDILKFNQDKPGFKEEVILGNKDDILEEENHKEDEPIVQNPFLENFWKPEQKTFNQSGLFEESSDFSNDWSGGDVTLNFS